MRKKKLVTNPDGSLSYPHQFRVGALVSVDRAANPGLRDNGLGLVTTLDNENMTVFWQESGHTSVYSIATAVLSLRQMD